MRILIKNIKTLVQVEEKPRTMVIGKEMKTLPCINDAWLAIEDGLILDCGSMNDFPGITDWNNLHLIDATDKLVFPSWCDSHTHIVYAGSREGEFVDRINGLTYEEIAQRGGGILNSATKLRNTSEEELLVSAKSRISEITSMGTGAVEIKSGYGLTVKDELKMLRVIKKLKESSELTIKATFLGAHAVPIEFKSNKRKYIDLLLNEMIPAVAQEKLADFCDVFCENGYFSKEETIEILECAGKHGINGKVHAEQLSHSGGIEAGVQCNAISVDHLEFTNEKDIELLKLSKTMPTVLPGAAFFLGLPLPPARKMIDAGLPIAVATDYNPGSSPSGNMNFMLSLLCIQYKLTPEEAINAATINSAYAMNVERELGSIAIGKKANIFITKEIPSYSFIPYSFASNQIETIILNGKIIN
ncbi:MAG: imidazolonepropionase [Bacteroidetes bacterium]|nr:imidazolonepropionase [Bacteroidota bacterium]